MRIERIINGAVALGWRAVLWTAHVIGSIVVGIVIVAVILWGVWSLVEFLAV